MTLLHDYFITRNLQGFQRLLDGRPERNAGTTGTESSFNGGGSKSWAQRSWGMTHALAICDVNAKDSFGRTALHHACSRLDSIEYVRALLKHPNIDVNMPDMESLWTPLHRALYSANFPATLLLLQRSDIVVYVKDFEGYTAFDLYNSTINGTKPDVQDVHADLYTWGTNRNAALGVNDGNDRGFPEHVSVKSKEDSAALARMMVVTEEPENNLRLCGFGSGGRLGQYHSTQYALQPLASAASLTLSISRVALGQDHTLVLTTLGEVYSWGLNRFAQLGYVSELATSGSSSYPSNREEEPIQGLPKRVVGLLRREIVCGVAAAKNASACWTKEAVFTWGTNTGQLGYDKNAQPVQITPRPVTKFSGPVIDLALSDTVLVGLLVSRHVECIWNDRHYRISFPLHAFPLGIEPYRPPQSIRDSQISKVTTCDGNFAALSSNGEVFVFSAPGLTTSTSRTILNSGLSPENSSSAVEAKAFKPHRVWTLRKNISAAKDVALGSEGSIILCTESGHVFVRSRNTAKSASSTITASTSSKSSNTNFKFERVPLLQRVTHVCANNAGAYGALRVDYGSEPSRMMVDVVGMKIEQDVGRVQPFMEFYQEPAEKLEGRNVPIAFASDESSRGIDHETGEFEDIGIVRDIAALLQLCHVLTCEQRKRKSAGGSLHFEFGNGLPHGADAMLFVQPHGATFPIHRVILASRSSILANLINNSKYKPSDCSQTSSNITIGLLPPKAGPGRGISKIFRIIFSKCHPLSVLILLKYLYSDDLIGFWDLRISTVKSVKEALTQMGVSISKLKCDLQILAKILELPSLLTALDSPVKREPAPTMARDMKLLFDSVQLSPSSLSASKSWPYAIAPDVVLQLADGKEVFCHSIILRARSALFESFFGLEDWTVNRWDTDGLIRINLKHLNWHVLRFVLNFMCCGVEFEMFDVLDFVNSVEDLIQFMFEVLAAANELLLDRLILICSSIILKHTNIFNACYILAEATQYHIDSLVKKLQEYISVNIEIFLENHFLDEIPYSLVKQLAKFVAQRQKEKSPFSRGDAFTELLDKHKEWLVEKEKEWEIEASRKKEYDSKISRPALTNVSLELLANSPKTALFVPQRSTRRAPSGDDIFMMDDNEISFPAVTPDTSSPSLPISTIPISSPSPVWKAYGAPRVDMKALMAEEGMKIQMASSRAPGQQVPRPSLTKGSSNTPGIPFYFEGSSSRIPPRPKADALRYGSATPANNPSVAFIFKDESRPSPPTARTPGRNLFPSLGPVISPVHLSPSKQATSSVRNASGSKAWTASPVAEPLPAAKGMSLIAIQYSQQEQGAVAIKDKRSLREIQEEEQALQAEAEFMKWWTAEEERVRQEGLALAQFQSNLLTEPTNKNAGKPSKQKHKYSKPKSSPKDLPDRDSGQSIVGDSSNNSHPRKQPQKSRQKNNPHTSPPQ